MKMERTTKQYIEKANHKRKAKGWVEKRGELDRTKWKEGVQAIAMRNIRPPPLTGQNRIKIGIIIIHWASSVKILRALCRYTTWL